VVAVESPDSYLLQFGTTFLTVSSQLRLLPLTGEDITPGKWQHASPISPGFLLLSRK